jgi:hypothetical protein
MLPPEAGSTPAPKHHFTPFYAPDAHLLDESRPRSRKYEKKPIEVIDWQRDMAPRCPRVFDALIRISRGRPRFSCQIRQIVAVAGCCRRTVQLALHDLEDFGFIERKLIKDPARPLLNLHSEYTLPHLISATRE